MTMEFEDVVTQSSDVESFNRNVRRYLQERSDLSQKERRSHYWALFYAWKESFKK